MPTDKDLRDFYHSPLAAADIEQLRRFADRLTDEPARPVATVPRIRRVLPALAAALVIAVVVGAVAVNSHHNGPSPAQPTANSSAIPVRTVDPARTTGPQATTPGAIAGFVAAPVVDPSAGAKNVRPGEPVVVSVSGATLSAIIATAANGTAVPGIYNSDRTRWTSSGPLASGTAYRVRGIATLPGGGAQTSIDSGFTTIAATRLMDTRLNISSGATVGVAAPIIVTFSGSVTDKPAAERAMVVTTSAGNRIAGNWAWFTDTETGGGSQAHWRPTRSTGSGLPYWPAGTQVSVHLNLLGVELANGIWGRSDSVLTFAIRPQSQVVLADVASGKLTVEEDGHVVKSYLAAFDAGTGQRYLLNGVHVATELQKVATLSCPPGSSCTSMTESDFIRINDNGEAIAAPNPPDVRQGGRPPGGRIVLSAADAADLYGRVRYGDPVVVSGSPGGAGLTAQDPLFDWIYTAAQWESLSTLR